MLCECTIQSHKKGSTLLLAFLHFSLILYFIRFRKGQAKSDTNGLALLGTLALALVTTLALGLALVAGALALDVAIGLATCAYTIVPQGSV
jgi:hypothetical protein